MNEEQAELIAEQMRHAQDLLRADLEAVRSLLDHERELTRQRLDSLERANQDHENRLRSVSDGVTQLKVWSGLVNGGSSMMAVAAFLKAFLGL